MIYIKNIIAIVFAVSTPVIISQFSLNSSEKKVNLQKKQNINQIRIKATQKYQVFNEQGKLINASVFINHKMFSGERTKELIIYFKIKPQPFVLTVALDSKLIGIPELYHTMQLNKNTLSLKKESLKFTVINVGIEKMIDEWSIKDDLIQFDTFHKLKPLGKKIIIKAVQ